jgi:methylglutaconyl-CoA hydratase
MLEFNYTQAILITENNMPNYIKITHPQDHVVELTLANPEKENRLNGEMIKELIESLRELEEDTSLRVLVLTGEGDVFCGGADVDWIREAQDHPTMPHLDPGSRIVDALHELDIFPRPMIAKVNGDAFGGGASMLACSDIAIASESCQMGFQEITFGMVPGAAAVFASNAIGLNQSNRWLLTGETMSADKAQEIGLVHEVVADDQLDEEVNRQIELLLKGGPRAQRETKKLLRQLSERDKYQTPAYRTAFGHIFQRCLSSIEGKRGIEAFMNNEPTPWSKKD